MFDFGRRKLVADAERNWGCSYHIHETYMDRLMQSGVVVSHDLVWNFDEKPVIELDGVIRLPEGLCLGVHKVLNVDDQGYCRTVVYSYNLFICGQTKTEIFRYDNYHPERPHDGHTSPLHHHRFDPPGQEIADSPFEVKVEDWPELADVIREGFKIAKTWSAKSD